MLVLRPDVVLHADRHWRGQFGTGKAGHFSQLVVDATLNPLFCQAVTNDVGSKSAGMSSSMVPSLVAQLSGKVYPWEEKVITLSLTQVWSLSGWLPTGSHRLPLLQRKWQWMHIRLSKEDTSSWLVWLDDQLTRGRLIG